MDPRQNFAFVETRGNLRQLLPSTFIPFNPSKYWGGQLDPRKMVAFVEGVQVQQAVWGQLLPGTFNPNR
jgi:hypothetical protein